MPNVGPMDLRLVVDAPRLKGTMLRGDQLRDRTPQLLTASPMGTSHIGLEVCVHESTEQLAIAAERGQPLRGRRGLAVALLPQHVLQIPTRMEEKEPRFQPPMGGRSTLPLPMPVQRVGGGRGSMYGHGRADVMLSGGTPSAAATVSPCLVYASDGRMCYEVLSSAYLD
jgi:hypothetical protein